MTETTTTCFDKVSSWLQTDAIRDRLARALPKGLGVDAWIEAALVQARATRGIGSPLGRDAVAYADPASVLGALFAHATLGLRLEGPLGQAYFQCTPRKRKGAGGEWEVHLIECTAGVGYKGLCALAYQDAAVREPEAVLVYEGDALTAVKGTTPRLEHTINVAGTSRRIAAAYAGLRYRDGYYSFQCYRGVDLEEHRRQVLLVNNSWELELDPETGTERFFETYQGKRKAVPDFKVRGVPWAAHGHAMLQKTALRWAAKYWNLGAGFDTAATLLAQEEAGVSQGLAEAGRSVLLQTAAPAADVHAEDPALIDQLVAEATGQSPAAGITAEEAREIAARERAEYAQVAPPEDDPF